MVINSEEWKKQINKLLGNWKDKFQSSGINSLYYFLAATAFIPIIQAYFSTNDIAAIALLGSTVGSNLLASLIQNMKDKNENQVSKILRAEGEKNGDIKKELDILLKKLDILSMAQNSLSLEDKEWFVKTIEKENKESNNIYSFFADENQGIIFQGNGSKNVSITQTTVNIGSQHSDDDNDSKNTYLRNIRKYCQSLPLAALGGEEEVEEDVTLDNVYIDLDTTCSITKKELSIIRSGKGNASRILGKYQGVSNLKERKISTDGDFVLLPIYDVFSVFSHIVLLGEPGAGKSTFVKKIIGWQAAALLNECPFPKGIRKNCIPLLIIIRDLAPKISSLNLTNLSEDYQNEELRKILVNQIKEDLAHFKAEDFADNIDEIIQNENAFIVFDGLDEVPVIIRGQIRKAIISFSSRYKNIKIIVTCRVRSYGEEAIINGFQPFVIANLDSNKIKKFAFGWYNAQERLGRFTKEQATKKAQSLAVASLNEDLRELSRNPMMLTSMAIIHQREIDLPKGRVRLYSLVVDVLLHRWQKHKTGTALLADLLKDEARLRTTIERLAFEAQKLSSSSSSSIDLARGNALEILEDPQILGDIKLASEFLDYVDQRAGLLIGRGGDQDHPNTYGFPHRTFQEYLAGCYLIGSRDLARMYYQCAQAGDLWDLAVILGAEELLYNRRNKNALLDLAYALCGNSFPKNQSSQRTTLWSGQIAALLGIETIKADKGIPSGGIDYLNKIRKHMIEVLKSPLAPSERVEAGRVLAEIGDPREEVLTWGKMIFCKIPDSELLISGEKISIQNCYLSKFMISNAQFKEFSIDDEFSNEKYWIDAITDNKWENGKLKIRPSYFENQQQLSTPPFLDLPNYPVCISFYEAKAYTAWLSDKITKKGYFCTQNTTELLKAESSIKISLPILEFWDYGVYGIGKRNYPWGDKFSINCANTSETKIGKICALGCFPAGENQYGLSDTIGNVFEWIDSANQRRFGNALLGKRAIIRGSAYFEIGEMGRTDITDIIAPRDMKIGGIRVMITN